MKHIFLFSMMLAFAAAAEIDPTVPSDGLKTRLRGEIAASSACRIKALVVGGDGDGVALLGDDSVLVRRGSTVAVTVDGVKFEMAVAKVDEKGVTLGGEGEGVVLGGAYRPLPAAEGEKAEFLRYLECEKIPLATAVRLISDQTGVNIVPTERCAKKEVSIFLRNVSAEAAVEEICRGAGLWYRREQKGSIIRVSTMDEYGENLNTFREESTELFTLLYPNVIEVASVVYGLYPDRTFLSLGEEELQQDDEYDLSRRFRRFRVLEDNGGSQFLDMEPPQTSSTSSGTGSGDFSFSRGSAASRITQWDQLRDRNRRGGTRSEVTADDAKLMEFAYRSGNTNLLQIVRNQISPAAANIFVSMSRKNNMLIVRTSDLKIMDEIRALVKKLDVPTPMVLMEVKVLELDITDDYEAGFTWSLTSPDHTDDDNGSILTHSLGHKGAATQNLTAKAMQTGMNAVNPTLQLGIVSDYISSQIKMMQKDGKVKTLATPTLLVANNEVSRIFTGKEYPLVTGWTAGSTDVSEGVAVTIPSTVEIEKKDVGTMLLITPNINADKTVTLRMLQENSEVAAEKVDIPVTGSTTDAGDVRSIEYVESRQLAGTFVAKDNLTVMAGGLIKEQDEVTYWRTPFLGSLPIVGWLFRGTEKAKRRTELVVLIKPHVISTPMEGGKISAELMEALSAHPARDGRASLEVLKDGEKTHNLKDDKDNLIK